MTHPRVKLGSDIERQSACPARDSGRPDSIDKRARRRRAWTNARRAWRSTRRASGALSGWRAITPERSSAGEAPRRRSGEGVLARAMAFVDDRASYGRRPGSRTRQRPRGIEAKRWRPAVEGARAETVARRREAANKKPGSLKGFRASSDVGETGFEPATPWTRTKCSTRLSHSPNPGLVALRAACRNSGASYLLALLAYVNTLAFPAMPSLSREPRGKLAPGGRRSHRSERLQPEDELSMARSAAFGSRYRPGKVPGRPVGPFSIAKLASLRLGLDPLLYGQVWASGRPS